MEGELYSCGKIGKILIMLSAFSVGGWGGGSSDPRSSSICTLASYMTASP